MIKYTKWKWIYVLDAIYDIALYLEFLNNKWVNILSEQRKIDGILMLKIIENWS